MIPSLTPTGNPIRLVAPVTKNEIESLRVADPLTPCTTIFWVPTFCKINFRAIDVPVAVAISESFTKRDKAAEELATPAIDIVSATVFVIGSNAGINIGCVSGESIRTAKLLSYTEMYISEASALRSTCEPVASLNKMAIF